MGDVKVNNIAFIFPGQGSQASGMGRALADVYPEARAVFEEADEALGFGLSTLCFEGTDADLRPTEVAQPALLTHSVAALRCIEKLGITPVVTAGHSLGEYSALVAAGALSFVSALRLVRTRGLLMAEAGELHPGAMAAVIGLDSERVAALCQEVCNAMGNDETVVAANYNAPGQVVISGTVAAVKAAGEKAKASGAGRVIPLAVSGAFHSPLMREAAQAMEEELSDADIQPASVPVIANTTARALTSPEEIRTALVAQVQSSVRWEESVRAMAGMGVTHYVELGPGKVLCGLVRKILPGALTFNVGEPVGVDGLEAFLATGA